MLNRLFGTANHNVSYSQCGEDRIIAFVLNGLKIQPVTYLDIGAYHPTILSNTYLFYVWGGQGVCVEPNPTLCKQIKKQRRRDVCLNAGIGVSGQTESDFYVMSSDTLSTFAQEEAQRYQDYGAQRIEKVIRLPLLDINDVLAQRFTNCPNLISLDTEGFDLAILQTFDFSRFRPQVFCVETLTYTEDRTEKKIGEIANLMSRVGYLTYADTYINTIFVDERVWHNR